MRGSLELSSAPSSSGLLSVLWFFGVPVGWGASEPVVICSWGEAELKALFQMELVSFPP